MFDSLMDIAKWIPLVMAFIALIIGYLVAFRLLGYLINETCSFIAFLVDEITKLLEWFLRALFRELFNGLASLVTVLPVTIWKALASFIKLARNTLSVYLSHWKAAQEEQNKLWELWLEHGVSNFDSFAAFKRAMRGEEEPRNEGEDTINNEPEPAKDSYREALNMMGLSENEEFTKADLKKRYHELSNRVHPDKGCPTRVFLQQLSEANDLIKQRINW